RRATPADRRLGCSRCHLAISPARGTWARATVDDAAPEPIRSRRASADDADVHCPSPNLSLTNTVMASAAFASSDPSTSSSISVPWPAASIITPMMLLAFTRRPPRVRCTSLAKLLASLVSFADARACNPSLLLIVSTVLIMVSGSGCLSLRTARCELHDALHRAGHRALGHREQRLGAMGDCTPQHRHVHSCDDAHMHAVGQAHRGVAGRGAKDVGQHQNLGLAEARHRLTGGLLHLLGRGVSVDVDRLDAGVIREH